MKLKIDMTLNEATAQRFRETADRLAHLDGDDALLAAAILLRIADSYDRAARDAGQSLHVDQLNAENDE